VEIQKSQSTIKTGDNWVDKTGIYEIGFIVNSEDEIAGMTLIVKTEFRRGIPVTNALSRF